ncbi:hypothetical protein L917_21155 [Phytophthora nicotianae]|uniref:Uncharacterized protein n=2 Tax=Phytophthora nicotianae TaxID=4792 RepID=V9DW84_PHYNI|nr:hypothetical protein F443_22030 [Phytophthora nicotianae P1569]ETL77957.1 hypothetical protein L917_21155 [Phytophthora nicotianae]
MDKRALQDISNPSTSTTGHSASEKTITSDEAEERGLSSQMEYLKNLLMRHPYFMDKLYALLAVIISPDYTA